MNIRSKSGITVSSLVLYVVLFFGVTTFLSIVYSNMNETMFNNRGMALNYTMLNKLEYNLVDSSANSTNVTIVNEVVTFSNGDSYYYDANKKVILLNSGILCTSVSGFNPTLTTNGKIKKLTIEVSFNKYLATLNRTIICSVEVA